MPDGPINFPENKLANDACVPLAQAGPPGPQGLPGADGAEGLNGQSAFTTTTEGFTMPAQGTSITIEVENSDWAINDVYIFIEDAGFFQVASIPNPTELEITNIGGSDNVFPATAIGTGKAVVCAGAKGATGDVDSVTLVMPPEFSVAGSPLTTGGTITISKETQNQNRFFASPDGANGDPVFRSIVQDDLPNLDVSKLSSGVLPFARGGTGQATRQASIDALLSLAAKGDLIIRDVSGNAVALTVGSDGQILRANSSDTKGMTWEDFTTPVAKGVLSSASTTIVLADTAQFVAVDTSAMAINCTVTAPSNPEDGHIITLKDVGGNAGTRNIQFIANAGQSLEGGVGSLNITIDFGRLNLIYINSSSTWFLDQ